MLGLSLSFAVSPMPLFSNNLKPYYPPTLTGIRGNHVGAFEHAHKIAFEEKKYKADMKLNDQYDVIIVGAGISGLSAALIYLKKIDKNTKILILDNHDDLGGHAKRNEFYINGEVLLSYGGTQSFDNISSYSKTTNSLLKYLEIDLLKFESYYDKDFFERYNLTSGIFYDKDNFGKNSLIKSMLPLNQEFETFSNGYMPYLKKSS